MNKKEQQLFVAFFEEIYETQAILDFIKLQLVQSNGYNPNLLFDLISEKTETITLQQMRNYLHQRVAYNQRQLYQIFQRFDWSRQGKISRIDFLSQLIPFGKSIDSLKQTGGTITAEIEGHLISLFIQILKRFRIQDVARKQIVFIQPYDAFAHIDYLKSGLIGISDLRKIFQDNDFNINDQQLYYLLHGLRRRCYKEINLEVFCENLNPLQFGQYAAYADQLDQERQSSFLSRSRREQETMKRSRLQAQKIQHQFQKAERKKQAEVERHLELQERINRQIISYEQQQEKQIRRALLQEDKQIRHTTALGADLYQQERLRLLQQANYQNQVLENIRIKQSEQKAVLLRQSVRRQAQLQNSRKILQLQRDKVYRQELQNSRRAYELERQRALLRERQIQRKNIEYEREKLHWSNLQRQKAKQKAKQIERERQLLRTAAVARQIELSRKRLEQQNLRNRRFEQLELEKMRAREELYGTIKHCRTPEYQKQLQRTRYQIAQRKSRLAMALQGSRR